MQGAGFSVEGGRWKVQGAGYRVQGAGCKSSFASASVVQAWQNTGGLVEGSAVRAQLKID